MAKPSCLISSFRNPGDQHLRGRDPSLPMAQTGFAVVGLTTKGFSFPELAGLMGKVCTAFASNCGFTHPVGSVCLWRVEWELGPSTVQPGYSQWHPSRAAMHTVEPAGNTWPLVLPHPPLLERTSSRDSQKMFSAFYCLRSPVVRGLLFRHFTRLGNRHSCSCYLNEKTEARGW